MTAPQTGSSPTPAPSTIAGPSSGSRPSTPAVPAPVAPKPVSPPTPQPVSTPSPEPELVAQHYRGQGGKPLRVTANYIRLEVVGGRGVFEHEVQFSPRIDSQDERHRLVNQQRDIIGRIKVFNGYNLFLPKMIEGGRMELVSKESHELNDVTVRIIFKKQHDMSSMQLLSMYNNVFCRIMRALKFIQHNRKFFDPTKANKIAAYNLEVWPGMVTAVDRFEGGLLLQLDGASRVLRTETARDVLMNISKKIKSTGGSMKQEAEKQLLGESILTRYNNKSYIVDDINFEMSPKSTFVSEKGVRWTFLAYYKEMYGLEIKDKDQPLIINRPKKKAQAQEGVDTMICLVPELCLMTGLTDTMRADFKIMKEVGNFTRLTPKQRQDVLHQFVQTVKEHEEASIYLTEWGLKLNDSTLPLEGRQLPPEVLHFGKGYKEQVNPKADWGRAATSKQVLTPVPLTKWAVVFVSKNQSIVKQFCQVLSQQGPKMGINVAMPKVVGLDNDRTETYLKAVRAIIEPGVQLVVTIFPQMRSDRYAAIKKLCVAEKPVASQCVNLKTISNEKKVTSVVQKIALQINCKLGGELWGTATPYKDLMVVGIDVYHDKTKKSGSVAGVVASLNDSLSRYFSRAVFQGEGQEIMDALKTAFVDSLIKYWEVNHRWPQHIVVFRDGVGDGQLEVAEKHEAEQFIRTFRHVNGNGGDTKLDEMLPEDYNPGFTFVVVQKRINTRIYLQTGPKNYDNPPCGTIVDHTVTRFKYKDFFLVPQSVNQGTVTPTHFIVLRELGTEPNAEVNRKPVPKLEATDIQKLAYKLTHMYFNWPGTVRVPAPVQYAHKLVDLVGQYVHRCPAPQLEDKLFYL